MFSVTFTVNKSKAHFKFGHDRTDVTDSESNLITSIGDTETITVAVLTFHMDKSQQGNNSTALCWCFLDPKLNGLHYPTRKAHKRHKIVKKARSYSTRTFALTEQRTHARGSSIHLSYPPLHIAPFLWKGTQVTTAVLSAGMLHYQHGRSSRESSEGRQQ